MLKLMTLMVVILLYGTAVAQELMIYPARTRAMNRRRKTNSHVTRGRRVKPGSIRWRRRQATTSAPAQQTKSVARGAAVGGVGGAALGAGIGAIAGGSSGAGRGAGIGALAGGTFGGVRSHSQNQQAEQAQRQREQEQMAQYQQSRSNYNRAYSACLEGRGYTVR